MHRMVVFLIILIIPAITHGENYYVATWGNDNYNGLSWDSAFATLQHAADIVSTGDSALIANGDYIGFNLETSGNSSQPVVFKAYGDSVRIIAQNNVTPDGINVENADWVVIDGFNVISITRAGIRVAVSQHVIIKNNYCSNNGRWAIFTGFADYAVIENNICEYSQDEHGIYFSNSADHPTIRNNICHHNYGNGIHLNGDASMGGDGLITDATIESNIIYENGEGGGSGINCDGVAESRIYNNLLYQNHASGISLYQIDASTGAYNTKVFNNTVINATDGRWCLNINTDSYGDTIYNNILINLHPWRGSIVIDESSLPGFFSDYNIVIDRMSSDGDNTIISLAEWQLLGYDLHSMLADPLDSIFTDWQAGDYHLQQNSQAIDAGTAAVAGIVSDDLDGTPRPQGSGHDIGAYEDVAGGICEEQSSSTSDLKNCAINAGVNYVKFNKLQRGTFIRIFDFSGRSVHESGQIQCSIYCWDVKGIPSGVYFYLVNSNRTQVQQKGKIVLIK